MPVPVRRSSFLTKRKGSQDVNSNDIKEDSEPLYTEEQKEAVDRVLNCKDYYQILGVSKDISEADLRKQYKKLAFQLHPDKNKAPGAVDAFKSIGNAFAVLNDPVKREKYDTYASQAAKHKDGYPARDFNANTFTFEGDISPEELYNMFFQGHHTFVRRGSQWQRYYTRASSYREEESSRSVLLQVLPLLFIVCVSLMSATFVSDPPYSLQKTPKYLYEQRTQNLDVPYFVKDNFQSKYKDRIADIEKNVEEEYIITVRTSCFRERNYKENMIYRAKHFKDLALEAKAKELRTPSCDILNDLYHALYS